MNVFSIIWSFMEGIFDAVRHLLQWFFEPLVFGNDSTSLLGLLFGGAFIVWIILSIVRD